MSKKVKIVDVVKVNDGWHGKGEFKTYLIPALITLIPIALIWYLVIPAINLKDEGFWFWIIMSLFLYMINLTIYATAKKKPFSLKVSVYALLAMVLFIVIASFQGSRIFNAKRYSEILNVQDGDVELIPNVEKTNSIALMDTTSAERLGDRKIGSLSGVVSQYNVGSYMQIDHQTAPVKVAPLTYDGLFKWMSNKNNGVPGYVLVNPVDMSADYISLKEGMKYVPSAFFSKDLARHIRAHYPTVLFDNMHFEIDEEGNPWYVASIYNHTIGLFGGTKVTGAFVVNPITGEITKYDAGNVPQWVDVVFSGDLICTQYNDYAQLQHGFLNSKFAQKDCRRVTTMNNEEDEAYPDYGYVAKDGDIWIYTGITSVNGDSSNIGFILANERTSETRFISSAGADEFSAMKSAEGEVQEKRYRASFPSLVNVDGTPTYIMVLKDANNLVKMYAMVNVEQYNLVSTATTQEECVAKYKELVHGEMDLDVDSSKDDYEKKTITIKKIQTIDIEGNTWIYVIDNNDNIYKNKYTNVLNMLLYDVGDKIDILTDGELFIFE